MKAQRASPARLVVVAVAAKAAAELLGELRAAAAAERPARARAAWPARRQEAAVRPPAAHPAAGVALPV